jgi:tRNA(His) guanylyltransferase
MFLQHQRVRNHNNTYAYWIFRKIGYKPAEIAKKLKGLKTKKFHEMMFEQDVNLAKTPQWQRRGILIYKQQFLKRANNKFRVLEWTKQKRKK